jgi:methyl-accepting chemotaxis protein
MKTNKRMSISYKILAMTLSLLLLTILIPALLVYVNSQKTALETAQRELQQTSLLAQKALVSWTNFLELDLETLGTFNNVRSATKSSFIGKASRKSASKQFSKKIEEFKFYESLSISDAKGVVVVSTDADILNKNISDSNHFRRSNEGSTVISTITLNGQTGNANFIISAPIFENDNIIGTVFGKIDFGYFEKDFVSPIKIGESGFVSITGKDGLYISHPNRSTLLKVNRQKIGITDTEAKNGAGVIRHQQEGQDAFSAIRIVPETGWMIIVTAISDELLAALNQLTLINGIISLVMLVLAGLVSIYFTGKIKTPLVKAVKMLDELAKGKYGNRIEVKSRDEMEEMADSMNRLASDLQSATTSINNAMRLVAEGNLSQTVDADLKGELKTLQTSVNESIDLLSETISHVVTTSDMVKTGTDEILSAADNLANGNSQQAASLEEITSSMNEIESQTRQNDENAAQANQLASNALITVREGNQKMNTLQQSMVKINETSTNVSKVIKAIDEIAFQTNLLALNAAVEAARAGKYGKGFAVVADEVRNLAGRSAVAAKDTTELIETSIREVENGVTSSDETAAVLTEITGAVEKITDLVSEISSSSAEQSRGIVEVNKGLSLVNNVVQQNSSIAEETSASAQELSSSANRLQNLVKVFVLKNVKKHNEVFKPALPSEAKQPVAAIEMNPKTKPEPKRQQIVLDDSDFGKY